MLAAVIHRLIILGMVTSLIAGISINAAAIAAQPRAEVAEPASAAVFYSQLEAEGRFSELYTYLHPDAQAIIPEAAVVGWYENEFAPLGPGLITVTGMQIVSWTWGVTGTTYPETAEVSYRQPFADGSVAEDVVRLVAHEGEWRWFFGRSREFVDEQIAVYSGTARAASPDSCNGDAEWWASTYPRIIAVEYNAYTLPGFWSQLYGGGTVSEELLRDYQNNLARLYDQQLSSNPPPAAAPLHEQFLEVLALYEHASSRMAAIAPEYAEASLVELGSLSSALDSLGEGEEQLETLRNATDTFLTTCQPLVVFVPGMGEDLPSPVMPGEVGPRIPPVECRLFETQQDAQRFFDAAGTGDPHDLDRDGDGIACEANE